MKKIIYGSDEICSHNAALAQRAIQDFVCSSAHCTLIFLLKVSSVENWKLRQVSPKVEWTKSLKILTQKLFSIYQKPWACEEKRIFNFHFLLRFSYVLRNRFSGGGTESLNWIIMSDIWCNTLYFLLFFTFLQWSSRENFQSLKTFSFAHILNFLHKISWCLNLVWMFKI